jgi:hypothetical protein
VVATSILDAAPERVISMPASSYTPAVLALGLLLIFVGVLLESAIVLIIGGLTVAASLAVWLWRSPPSDPEWNQALPAVGPPVRLPWTGTLSRWGMILFIIAEAIIFLELIVSYFAIRGNVDEWPPGGIGLPELLFPSILTAIIITTSLTMIWATAAGGGTAPEPCDWPWELL